MRTHNFAKHLATALAKPATESQSVTTGDVVISQEGVVGGAIKGAVGGIIPGVSVVHGAYRGHNIENLNKKIKEIDEEISKTKDEIAELTQHRKAATEGLVGVAAGAAAGLIPGISMGTGAAMGAADHALREKLEKKEEELKRLKERHIDLMKAVREALSEAHAEMESLITATESEAVIAAPEGGEEVIEADMVPHDVEINLMAADDVGDQMGDVCDEAHSLHKATHALEAILLAVSQEANGIDAVSAKYVTLAVESITREWDSPVPLVPSIESFGGEISRREATLTLESNVKEIIKQVIAYLKNLWAKFVNLLKKFYQHITQGTGFLERKANAIKAKAEHMEGAPSDAELEIDAALARRISANGKVLDLLEIVDLADKILDGNLHTTAEEEQANAAWRAAFGALFTADESNFDERVGAFNEINQKVGKVAGGLFTEDGGKRTHELPGGVSYEMNAGDVISFTKHHYEGEIAATKLPMPSKVTIIKAASAAAASATKIRQGIANLTQLEKHAHAGIEAINDNVNISEAQARVLGRMVTNWKMSTSNMMRFLVDVLIDIVKAESAAMSLAEKALSHGSKPLHERAGEAVKEGAAKVGEAAHTAAAAVGDVAGKAGMAAASGAAKAAATVKEGMAGSKPAEAA